MVTIEPTNTPTATRPGPESARVISLRSRFLDSSQESIIDDVVVERLKAIGEASGDEHFFTEVVRLYLENTMPLIQTLERALEADEFETTRQVLHRLKGSSLSVGAKALGDLCAETYQDEISSYGLDERQQFVKKMRDLFYLSVAQLKSRE